MASLAILLFLVLVLVQVVVGDDVEVLARAQQAEGSLPRHGDVDVVVRPAPADHGVRFCRSDVGSLLVPRRLPEHKKDALDRTQRAVSSLLKSAP